MTMRAFGGKCPPLCLQIRAIDRSLVAGLALEYALPHAVGMHANSAGAVGMATVHGVVHVYLVKNAKTPMTEAISAITDTTEVQPTALPARCSS